ncbi:hypothetical protein CLFS41_38840 [Clostridium sp. FS41]|jgi:hypothetical protein|nr:hypothetical protein CLFS41_38840 [Clostridium sp. FS41]
MDSYWKGKYRELKQQDRTKDFMICLSWAITFIIAIGNCLISLLK